MARQFIYHMQGLNKTYPGGKKVLENIHLSFYPDAKIGVLGVNGSGKSTLLKIMAGSTRNSPARAGSPKAPRSAICRRSRSSIRRSTCAATSCSASSPRKAFSTAITNSP
jgi:ATPase subunit of ABC transporter with duplicated ATPase domains